MGRSTSDKLTILGVKGINQQERLADPVMELADARNLWAPNGRIEKRPGFWGVPRIPAFGEEWDIFADAEATYLKETPIGTFSETETFDSLPAGSRWYMGITALDGASGGEAADYPMGLGAYSVNSNDNTVWPIVEYWNGNAWAPLPCIEAQQMSSGSSVQQTSLHLNKLAGTSMPNWFCFPFPNDWALSTIHSISRLWLRFTIKSADDLTGFDATTSVNPTISLMAADSYDGNFRYFVVAPFPNSTRYIQTVGIGAHNLITQNAACMTGPEKAAEWRNWTITNNDGLASDAPPSVAVVPEFGSVYVAYNGVVLVHQAAIYGATDVADVARAESDPVFVGPNTDYDPAFVEQGGFPEARHIAYHRGEMWAANLAGSPQQIRWSAGTSIKTPGFKIWPTISTEFLADVDQGPITALFPWQDSVAVFKSDSIWQMVYTGLNALKLNTYRPEKIVAGIGCASHGSIQAIKGGLVFLAEDGVYFFNGNTAVKVSDRIQKYIDGISSGRRAWATSVHWRSKNCYLLAITTAGSAVNDRVLVWDYKNDSWWVWDGIEAATLFAAEGSDEQDRIFFANEVGQIFELGVGYHDYGSPIEGTLTTQRLSQENISQKLRAVTLLGTNLTRELTLEAQANDKPFLGLEVQEMDFTDPAEKEYSVAVYDVSHYTQERDRYKGTGELKSGEWFRLKLTHDEKDAPFALNSMELSIVPTGVRH